MELAGEKGVGDIKWKSKSAVLNWAPYTASQETISKVWVDF